MHKFTFSKIFTVIILFAFSASMSQAVTVSDAQRLIASDGTDRDNFGFSVSISGNTAIIGAQYDDINGSNSGSAYIFNKEGNHWVQGTKLVPNDGAAYDSFGWSVSIYGDFVFVGAPTDDDGGDSTGSVYVFKKTEGIWNQQSKLLASDRSPGDRFGWSISSSGNRVVIGAYGVDDKGSNSGAAYIFEWNGSIWFEVVKLTAEDGLEEDRFGYAVALSNDHAMIGAINKADDTGAAYVYEFNGTTWNYITLLTAPTPTTDDNFGKSISLSDGIAIIGAPGSDLSGSDSGAVYMFKQEGSSWVYSTTISPNDISSGDYFGYSTGIDDNFVVVGAYGDDDYGSLSGSAYLFELSNDSFTQTSKFQTSDVNENDFFGYSVAINSNNVFVGAYENDANGYSSGSVYAYNIISHSSENKLIAYYPFNGNANDESGNGLHGTILGSPEFVDGILGQSIKLKGDTVNLYGAVNPTGDHVLLPFIDFNNLNSYTISLWVNEESMTFWHGNAYIYFGNHQYGWAGIGHFATDGYDPNSQKLVFAVGGSTWENTIQIPINLSDIGKFTHYCLAYENGIFKAYKNGVLLGQLNSYTNIYGTNSAIARDWWIDQYEISSTRLNGTIDEVRIYNYALTATEIQNLYNTSIQIDSDNDGILDNDDAFPNDPNEWADSDLDGVGDNQDVFPNDPNEFSDADNDGIGDNSDKCPQIYDPEQLDSDNDGIGDVCESGLNVGLIAYYPFNGNANDESGNEHNGIEYNGVRYINAGIGQAAIFDGENDYIRIPQSPELNFGGNDDYTISLFVKIDSYNLLSTTYIPIVEKWKYSSDPYPFVIRIYNFANRPNNTNDPEAEGDLYAAAYEKYDQNLGNISDYVFSKAKVTTDSELHHIVLTKKGVQFIRLYIDGVLIDEDSNIAAIDIYNETDIYLGAKENHPKYYKGIIDELRIYNRSLSETEIQEMHNQAVLDIDNDGDGFSQNQGDCDDTDLSIYPNALEVCDNKDNQCIGFSGYGIVDEQCSFENGLIAYYPFDTNANDISGNNYHGTEFGGINYITGLFGNAASFDGIDDYIRITQNPELNFDINNNFSISFFAKIDPSNLLKPGYYVPIVEKWNQNANTPYPFVIRIKDFTNTADQNIIDRNGSGDLLAASFERYPNYPYTYPLVSDMVFSKDITTADDQWHHIVFTKQNYQNNKLFIDGVLVDQDNYIEAFEIYNEIDIYLGAAEHVPHFFKGLLDDLRIYNRTLTEAEIKVLYNQLLTIDSDGDGVTDDQDGCPNDPDKLEAGFCGCGFSELDTNTDGEPDCIDNDDDGDGFTDQDETAQGTNPLDSNSFPLKPIITTFDVNPKNATDTVYATYTTTDDVGLYQAELWRASYNDSNCIAGTENTCQWIQVGDMQYISGTNYSGQITDTPPDGRFFYGIHVSDSAYNMATEPNGPIEIFKNVSQSEPDKDKDGVPDYLDNCANTPENEQVDENGCAPSQVDTESPIINYLTADKQGVSSGETITFTCSAHDLNNDLSKFCWFDFGDGLGKVGEFVNGISTVTYSYNQLGTFSVTCTVTDEAGNEVVSTPFIIKLSSKLHALIVGVDWDHGVNGKADAEAVYEMMKNYSHWADTNPEPLILDPDNNFSENGSNNDRIETALMEMLPNISPNDSFIFYFSGHGSINDEGENDETANYSSFFDLWNKSDETLITANPNQSLHAVFEEIHDDTFATWLGLNDADSRWNQVDKLIIIDACDSGGFWGDNNPADQGDLEKLPRVSLLASSPEGFPSVMDFDGRGLFTLSIIDQLSSGIAINDLQDNIGLWPLYGYIGRLLNFKYYPNLLGTSVIFERSMWRPVLRSSLDFKMSLPAPYLVDNDQDGFTENQGDLDDLNNTIYPGAIEIPYDGIDQDCSGSDLIDVDEDGFDGAQAGGTDCNDTDNTIYPGATEIPYDAIDQDCNGSDITDVDEDGHDAVEAGGKDCNDNENSIYPGATEIPYDGIDQDCNGSDLTDVDADGFDSTEAGGTDCNDNDATINPDAIEICDSIDNDCNELVDDGVYTLGDFEQPINMDGSSIFKAGRTIPVKISVTDCGGTNISAATLMIKLDKVSNQILGSYEEVLIDSSGESNDGSYFRYDQIDQHYIYNLSTRGLAKGTYQITVTSESGQSTDVMISLK